MMERYKPIRYPEEIEAEKESLSEQLIPLDGGRMLELFYNPKRKELIRLYIRDKDGKLTEFTDLKKPNDSYGYEEVQQQVAERFHILLTEKEAIKIAERIYEINARAEMDYKKTLE